MMSNSRPCTSLRQNSAATGTTASSGDSKTYKGHVFACLSPDGTRIVTGSHDKTAKVWDARTGTALLDLKGIQPR